MLASLVSVPGSEDRENEDFVAVMPDCAVLLDGAGTPAGAASGCTHGVAWYARQLGGALLAEMADRTLPLTGCLARAIARVVALHGDGCDLTHAGSPSATVVLARHNGPNLEYLVLADSALLIDRGDGNPLVLSDDRESQVGARYGREFRAIMDQADVRTPEHADAHRRYVETLRSYRNRAGGFWVASVDPEAGSEALTGTVPLLDVEAVALLSDGATRLADGFFLATWAEVAKILSTDDGPGELVRRVRAAEDSDPTGLRWPRGKHHDDATVAYLTGF